MPSLTGQQTDRKRGERRGEREFCILTCNGLSLHCSNVTFTQERSTFSTYCTLSIYGRGQEGQEIDCFTQGIKPGIMLIVSVISPATLIAQGKRVDSKPYNIWFRYCVRVTRVKVKSITLCTAQKYIFVFKCQETQFKSYREEGEKIKNKMQITPKVIKLQILI